MLTVLKQSEIGAAAHAGDGSDDMWIVVSGRDEFATHLMQDYAARCEARGLDKLASTVRAAASRLSAWQQANGGTVLPTAESEPERPKPPRPR